MAKEERRPRRTWIFQGNPKRYDLRDKLVPGETEAWEINAYRDEIQAGDIVYFWRSSGDEAIFGWGEVAREGSGDKPALKAGRDRIAVEYKEPFKEPIPREAIRADADLADLNILRQPSGTSYRVTTIEALALSRMVEGHTDDVNAVAISADGRRALSGADDGTVKLWNLETGACLQTLEMNSDFVTAVALSTNGELALSGSNDGYLILWNLETGDDVQTLVEIHRRDIVNCVALSADWTLKLWDLKRGKLLHKMEENGGEVLSAAFSADSGQALVGVSDGTLKLWDLETGSCVQTLAGHDGIVASVALLADGRRALSRAPLTGR